MHAQICRLPSSETQRAHDGFHAESAANEACAMLAQDTTALLLIDLDSPLGDHMVEGLLALAKEKSKPVILFGSPATPLLSAEKYRYYDSEITRYVFVRPFLMEQLLYCAAQLLTSDGNEPSEHSLAPTMKMKQHSAADALRLRAETHTAYYKNERISLTPTEYEVLALLLRRRGEVLSREEIFSSLSSDGMVGRAKQSSNLVDVYVRFLRQKLEIPYNVRLIETVRGVGYSIPLD